MIFCVVLYNFISIKNLNFIAILIMLDSDDNLLLYYLILKKMALCNTFHNEMIHILGVVFFFISEFFVYLYM